MRGWLLIGTLFALLLIGCRGDTGDADEQPAPAPDATEGTILTEDGLSLDARLFAADADRIVILLHMYHANQESWFATARAIRDRGVSALTFDFRGYGGSEGEVEPAGLDEDARAAVSFARSRGYERIVLVGASMGGTAAIVTAAAEDLDGVLTLSAPMEFRGLAAGKAVVAMDAPLAMIAAEGDTSAGHTISTFEEGTHVDPRWTLLVGGKAHGTDLLASPEAERVTQMLFEFLDEVWASGG